MYFIVFSCMFTLSFQSNIDQIEPNSGCPPNRFGMQCQHDCHCPEGDSCSHVNGLCHSGVCHQLWTGAGCQIRHPVMKDPPTVTSSLQDCTFTVSWSAWLEDHDTGHGPVAAYLLQVSSDTVQWMDVDVYSGTTNTHYSAQYRPANYSQDVLYQFRIVLYRSDDGKWVKSIPGPESEPAALNCTLFSFTTNTTVTAENTSTDELVSEVFIQLPVDWIRRPSQSQQPVHLEFTEQRRVMLSVNPEGMESWSDRFTVILTPLQSHNKANTRPGGQLIAITNQHRLDLGQLSLATYYKLEMSSTDNEGDAQGDARTIEGYFWTPPIKPPPPEPPSIINLTTNSVTILVHPLTGEQLEAQLSPIAFYRLLVEEVAKIRTAESRRLPPVNETGSGSREATPVRRGNAGRRSSGSGDAPAGQLGDPPGAYVAVQLPGNLSRDLVVTIGDGQMYAGYRNVPLKPDSQYNLWLAVSSRLDDVIVTTYVVAPETVTTAGSVPWWRRPPSVTSAGTDIRLIGLILGLLLLLLMVVVGIAALGCWLWKRRDPGREADGSGAPPSGSPFDSATGSCTLERKYVSAEALEDIGDVSPYGVIQKESDVGLTASPPPSANASNNTWIHLSELGRYLDPDAALERALSDQFRSIPKAFPDSAAVARQPENRPLNRSMEVIPYDRNRVRLYAGGYVNASVVRCFDDTTYVVTQTPMSIGVGAFWRTVWECDARQIVMLMNLREPGKPDCVQYWPDAGGGRTAAYGELSLWTTGTESTAHYVIRDIRIRNAATQAERALKHFQFTSWSAHGVPLHPIPYAEFVYRIRDSGATAGVTVLVHCHAGGGRSGMYVAVDSLHRQARQLAGVDVFRCVTRLRRERPSQVRTCGQYRFVHVCLAEMYDHPTSRIAAEHFGVAYSILVADNIRSYSRTMLNVEFEKLRRRRFQRRYRRRRRTDADADADGSPTPLSTSLAETAGGRQKHHSPATERSLPVLRPTGHTQEDFAVLALSGEPSFGPRFLDGYRRRSALIVADYPLDLDDFWSYLIANDVRMIVDVSCCLAVSPPAPTPLPRYFPVQETPFLDGRYKLSVTVPTSNPGHVASLTEIAVSRIGTDPDPDGGGDPEERLFSLVQWQGWPENAVLPSPVHLGEFLEAVRIWHGARCRDGGLVLILACHVGRAAFFSLAWSLCEKLENEWMVDVYMAAKYTQDVVPWVVNSLDHYKFLYRLMKEQIQRMHHTASPKYSGNLVRHQTALY